MPISLQLITKNTFWHPSSPLLCRHLTVNISSRVYRQCEVVSENPDERKRLSCSIPWTLIQPLDLFFSSLLCTFCVLRHVKESFFLLSCLQLEHLGRKQKLSFPLMGKKGVKHKYRLGGFSKEQWSDLKQRESSKTNERDGRRIVQGANDIETV